MTREREASCSAAEVRAIRDRILDLGKGLDDAGRIDLIRELEDLKATAALEQGRSTEGRAELLVCGDPSTLEGMGDRRIIAAARRTAHRLDPAAAVHHTDHAQAHAERGTTSAANGQGLCQACNHAKPAPAWTARPRSRLT